MEPFDRDLDQRTGINIESEVDGVTFRLVLPFCNRRLRQPTIALLVFLSNSVDSIGGGLRGNRISRMQMGDIFYLPQGKNTLSPKRDFADVRLRPRADAESEFHLLGLRHFILAVRDAGAVKSVFLQQALDVLIRPIDFSGSKQL